MKVFENVDRQSEFGNGTVLGKSHYPHNGMAAHPGRPIQGGMCLTIVP
jgi:hypothetical protein